MMLARTSLLAATSWPNGAWLTEWMTELASLPPLSFTDALTGRSLRHGDFLGQLLETGADASEHRLYQPGDSVRHINWRASARSQDVLVNYQHKPVDMSMQLLVHLSNSSWQGSGCRLKAEQMLKVAFRFAHVFAHRLPIHTQLLTEQVIELPKLHGRRQWDAWAQVWKPLLVTLAEQQLQALASSTSVAETPLTDWQPTTAAQVYCVVSDLLNWDDALKTHLLSLAEQSSLWLVQILDPLDVDLSKVADIRLGQAALSVTEEQVRDYQVWMQHRLQQIMLWCQTHGVHYVPLWSDAPLSAFGEQLDWSRHA